MDKSELGALPGNFAEELERQSKLIVIPAALIAIISWLPYIKLDQDLYPHATVVFYLRLGLSFCGFLALIFYFSPLFKFKSYTIVLMIMTYLELVTAIILGLVSADSTYMGGYCMVVLLIPLFPFKKKHAFILLGLSILLFCVFGLYTGMIFETPHQIYGLFNVILAFLCTFVAVPILDHNRRIRFRSKLMLERRNQQIEQQKNELQQAFEKINTLHGLLPICSNCKSIRDEEGYWHVLETYIQEHSDAEFSHSLCNDCFKKLYPDIPLDEKAT